MQLTYNDLLQEILTIIGYQDKEKYVREFEEMNKLEVMNNCLESLPPHIQDSIIAKKGDPEEIKKYIPQETYINEMVKVSAIALENFLIHMTPVLKTEHKEKIAALFVSHQVV